MREYKNFRIHVTAVPHRQNGWYPRGIVLDPDPNVRLEFERMECRNVLYHTIDEAEEAAFELCKHWIDKSFKLSIESGTSITPREAYGKVAARLPATDATPK